MCFKNDIIRENLHSQLVSLYEEEIYEGSFFFEIKQTKAEIEEIINLAQNAINNLSNCDFGGDKIISAVRKSQEGYKNKLDYYEEYLTLCRNAREEILEEKELIEQQIRNLPKNCGVCQECNPELYEGTTVTLSNNSKINKNNNKNDAQREVRL